MIVTAAAGDTGSLYAANGVELRYVVWADTETGEAVHIVFDDDNRPVTTHDEQGCVGVKTEWRQHQAPLRYVI